MGQLTMNFFKRLWELWGAIFSTPTVTDDITQRTHRAIQDIRHCDTAIDKARFQRHMSVCELEALEDWNHQRNVRDRFQHVES
jgi:hypothetical protein